MGALVGGMTLEAVTFALLLASQHPDSSGAPVPVDPAVWPYYVAIGALSTAVVTLFGVIMKLNASHSAEITKLNDDNQKALEKRSERVSDEFKDKDQKLYDVAVQVAGIVERSTATMDELGDRIDKLIEKTDKVLERLGGST